jgi:NADPH-dependent 2,4-dienoyl-CoA reductase/sulfur reductase-like enzyme
VASPASERPLPAGEIVVVGGGPAGLATADALGRAGLRPVVLEQGGAVGATWRQRYDGLRLNTSRLTSSPSRVRYPRGSALLPSRDQFVTYLECFAEQRQIEVRLGVRVRRIDREDSAWRLRTSAADVLAEQVVVATGHAHEPILPAWSGRERFEGALLHSRDYSNPEVFRECDVLVVGSGSSGMEIAQDLARGGAGRVWLSVRTPPNLVLRSLGGLPYPEEGPFTRLRRLGAAPAVVDASVIEMVKDRRIEVVGEVEALDATGVQLSDGARLEPDAIVAATGYRCGLEALVGHLDVLDRHGRPRTAGGREAAPGFRFVGFVPGPGQIRGMGREARRAAREITGSRRHAPRARGRASILE